MAATPNWVHNSGKKKKTKGCCKGVLKARKQALQALKNKLQTTEKSNDCN
jgi:hypothetical protein